ncbi:methyltransferase domain-containing protein [Haladaptatus sp. DYF46]|uniref:methyltransferase domain-containing protein n=1 Tax=Haladaptatus sp. DYF46 TaxID=2886041 RepID=UPI001E6139BA
MYDRSVTRDEYVFRWLDEVSVETGDAVVEVGSDPGRTAFRVAWRVGPSGVVYAIERNHDALRYLQKTMSETDLGNVELIHADAEGLPVRFAST